MIKKKSPITDYNNDVICGFYTGCVDSGNIGDDILFNIFINLLKKTIINGFNSECEIKNNNKILKIKKSLWMSKSKMGIIGGGSLIHPEEISYTVPLLLMEDYINRGLIFGTGISDTPKFKISEETRKNLLDYNFIDIEFPINNLMIKNIEIIKKIKNGKLRGPIDNIIAGINPSDFSYDPGLIAGKYINYNKIEREDKAIGINLCNVTSSNKISKKNESFEKYTNRIVKEIVKFCDFCLKMEYNIYFYSMAKGEEFLHKDVISKLKYKGNLEGRVKAYNYMTSENLLSLISSFRFTVSLRLHGNILANSVLTPSINMFYNFKGLNYMESTNQRLLGIPTNESLNCDNLILKLIYLEKNYDSIVKNIKSHINRADSIHTKSLLKVLKNIKLKNNDKYIIEFGNADQLCSVFNINKIKIK
jgi:hypothetical protein